MLNFSRSDILRHLSDLGYENVSDEKVDSFVRDLRKLIRYEEKKRRVGEKLDLLEQKNQQESSSNFPLRERTVSPPDSSTTSELTSRPRRRRVRKEDKIQTKTKEDSPITSSRSVDTTDKNVTSDQSDPSSLYIDVDLASQDKSTPTPLAVSLMDTKQAGFIRVRSGPNRGRKPVASDPVSLHQQYREDWAKFNIPGERSHNKLRWAVRGWMMGEEPL